MGALQLLGQRARYKISSRSLRCQRGPRTRSGDRRRDDGHDGHGLVPEGVPRGGARGRQRPAAVAAAQRLRQAQHRPTRRRRADGAAPELLRRQPRPGEAPRRVGRRCGADEPRRLQRAAHSGVRRPPAHRLLPPAEALAGRTAA